MSGKGRGGGVLIATNSRLRSREITVSSPSYDIDHVFVSLQVGSTSWLLGCVYIPPSSDYEAYVEHCNVVEELCYRFPESKICIVGDYNLSDATWSVDDEGSMVVNCPPSSSGVHLCESFNSVSLYQVNTIPNDHGVFLDLLFASDVDIATSPCVDPLLSNNFHHNAFSFDIPVLRQSELLPRDSIVYDYAKCDFVALKRYLNNVDWSFLSYNNDIEAITQRFYNFLSTGIESTTPIKRVFRTSYPVWFTKNLINLISEKKKAHSVYKGSKLESDYVRFSSLRSRCSCLSRQCYADYLRKSDESLKSNPRSFWKFVNVTRKIDGFPKNMYLHDIASDNGRKTANLFATSFSSAYYESSTRYSSSPGISSA